MNRPMSFRISGVPVRVEPIFFLIAALLAAHRLTEPWFLATWIAVVFGSVLLHELGHAIAFRRFGYAPTIQLHAMGGHTSGAAGLAPKEDMIISLAGPLVGLALGALIYGIGALFPAIYSAPFAGVVVRDLLWVNIGWSIINLLPILPMDGGRVLIAGLRAAERAPLEQSSRTRLRSFHSLRASLADPMRASLRAHQISMIAAGIAAAVALYLGMTFAAILGVLFAVDNYRAYQRLR